MAGFAVSGTRKRRNRPHEKHLPCRHVRPSSPWSARSRRHGCVDIDGRIWQCGRPGRPADRLCAKTHQIEQELDAAQRAHADNARIAGLRVALVKSRQCDDKALASDRAAKVEEKQRKVSERQETLDRELRDGDANRINRAKQKLDKATDELHKAQAEQSS